MIPDLFIFYSPLFIACFVIAFYSVISISVSITLVLNVPNYPSLSQIKENVTWMNLAIAFVLGIIPVVNLATALMGGVFILANIVRIIFTTKLFTSNFWHNTPFATREKQIKADTK
jgi:hypothetical protein